MGSAGLLEAMAGLPWIRRGVDWGFQRYAQSRCRWLDSSSHTSDCKPGR